MAKGGCGLLEGPVLQEPGEEQVSGLEELEVGFLFVLIVGQEPVGLEGQERRSHHNELDARPRSQSERMWAMKSSVTSASASSVTSRRLRAMTSRASLR